MFNKKVKTLLGIGTGLLGTTAVVTPLCCSCATTVVVPDDDDRTYNVGERQYQRLEGVYRSVIIAKTRKDSTDAGKTPEQIEKDVESANKQVSIELKSFREQKEKQNASFTNLTDAMIDKAHDDWDVSISRTFDSSINWSEENLKIQKQYSNSLRDRMMKDGILTRDQIDVQLRSFETKFSALTVKLGAEYADPLRAQNELKSQIATCFDDINNETSFIAANVTLKNFFKSYLFQPKTNDQNDEPIYWDDLKNNKDEKYTGIFNVAKPYEEQENINFTKWVNDNFVCLNTKTKKPISDFSLLDDTKPLIPDYRIIPVFKGFIEDRKTNSHEIAIDWTFIKTAQYKKKDKDVSLHVTAHSFALKNKDLIKSDSNYFQDYVLANDSEKEFNKYSLPVTNSYEKNELKEEYLDKLSFKWDSKDKCRYEQFFGSLDGSGVLGTVSKENLGKAGLTVAIKGAKEEYVSLTVLSEQTSVLPKENWTLLNHFDYNCDLISKIKLEDDKTHDVANALFASYKTSPYSNHFDTNDNIRWQPLDGNDKDWYRAKGFPISREIWVSAKSDFDKAKKFVSFIENNPIDSTRTHANNGETAMAVMLGILGGLEAFLIFQLIVTAGSSAAAVAMCSVCLGVCIVAICIQRFVVLKSVNQWYDEFETVRNSPSYQPIKADVENDGKQYFSDENVFRQTSWFIVRKLINKYKNFRNTDLAKTFTNLFKHQFDDDAFLHELLGKILTNNALSIAMITLTAGALVATLVVSFVAWAIPSFTEIVKLILAALAGMITAAFLAGMIVHGITTTNWKI